MRVPAISFDPPVAAPAGVAALHAAYAASRTAVSPDGRGARARRRREPWPAEEVEPQPEPDAPSADDAERLPVYYPPLLAQRTVLDRPTAEAPVADRHEVVPPRVWPASLPPDPESVLEQHLRRVMGAEGRRTY